MLSACKPFSDLQSFGDVAAFLALTEERLRGLLNNLRFHYRRGMHRKKNGEPRFLWKPSNPLKRVQKAIQRALIKIRLPRYVRGGVKGGAILANAMPHLGRHALLKVDVRRFFPSIRPQRVEHVFRQLGCGREAAGILTVLTTWEWELPQGAPTSPALANLVGLEMAARIAGLARWMGATYTVYVDDHSLSGGSDLAHAVPAVSKIARECGFRIHPGKKEFRTSEEEQVVTGVRIDHGVDVPSHKWTEIERVFAGALERGWEAVALKRKGKGDPLQSLLGRYSYVRMLNPGRARELASTLGNILLRWGYPSSADQGIRRVAVRVTGTHLL